MDWGTFFIIALDWRLLKRSKLQISFESVSLSNQSHSNQSHSNQSHSNQVSLESSLTQTERITLVFGGAFFEKGPLAPKKIINRPNEIMGWDLTLYAYRPEEHSSANETQICLGWDRQVSSHISDFSLVWAIEEGSQSAILRTKNYAYSNDDWPEAYKTRDSRQWIFRARKNVKICPMCQWFYDGPSSDNPMVIDTNNVHHSFGCSGDLMMSNWFVKNVSWALGTEPMVKSKIYDGFSSEDDEDELKDTYEPLFGDLGKNIKISDWELDGISHARSYLARMGPPKRECDIEALEETSSLLDWAENHLASDGVRVICLHDF
jgi:hypothetical protein